MHFLCKLIIGLSQYSFKDIQDEHIYIYIYIII